MQKVWNGSALNGKIEQKKIGEEMKRKGRAERLSFLFFI
jgi:hypothetical protein